MKRLQGFIAGILATLMLTGVFAVAKNMYEKIDVLYNDIKIEIDGEEFIAKDVNGNVVEPFIYNGTTYLPVRAIATAFDKDVAWDDTTYTVKLTTKEQTPSEAPEEKTKKNENTSEYGSNLTDEQLLGTWYGDVSSSLVDLGVPEKLTEGYRIAATYEFGADGKYKIYLPESSVDALVDASFEYALLAYGITAEQFPQMAGVSVEENKAQIKSELDSITDFTEEGSYRVENGVLYMVVEGNPEKVMDYTFEDGRLTLYEEGVKLTLTREITEE